MTRPARLLVTLSLVGCAPERGAATAPGDDCSVGWSQTIEGELTRITSVDSGTLDGPVTLQIFSPGGDARDPAGAPVIVYVQGGWGTDVVPIDPDAAHLVHGHGAVSLYLNLPGGSGENATGGTNDRRGAEARRAVGQALAYAAGDLHDSGGCTLGGRVPAGLNGVRVLAGFSNGGNLAWATLADAAIELPDVHGVATFETPAGSQFMVADVGGSRQPNPAYTAGSCALDDGLGVVCPLDYGDIAFEPGLSPDTDGILYQDVDQDGRFTEDPDYRLGEVWSVGAQAWVHSVEAAEAAEAQGVPWVGRADAATTRAFWMEREAPRALSAAVERFPNIGGIAVGTPEDHVLVEAGDHPHVIGLVEAMGAAGIAWRRLGSDASYARAVTGDSRQFTDHSADLDVRLGEPEPAMEPEDDATVTGAAYLTASALELADRAAAQDWSNDLDSALFPQ